MKDSYNWNKEKFFMVNNWFNFYILIAYLNSFMKGWSRWKGEFDFFSEVYWSDFSIKFICASNFFYVFLCNYYGLRTLFSEGYVLQQKDGDMDQEIPWLRRDHTSCCPDCRKYWRSTYPRPIYWSWKERKKTLNFLSS